MKKIFARISMELTVSDSEAESIFYNCGSSFFKDYSTGELRNNDFDLPDELAQRFLKEGTYSEGSSYVPEDSITEV